MATKSRAMAPGGPTPKGTAPRKTVAKKAPAKGGKKY